MRTSMKFGMSQKQKMGQDLAQRLVMPLEVSGDFALFSLHRIKNRIPSMGVSGEVKTNLVRNLIANNARYREESGKNWNCITPNYLDLSVDQTKRSIEEVSNNALATIDDYNLKKVVQNKFYEAIDVQYGTMKNWFVDNYDNLLYNMDQKIPFPIIRKLRDNLSQWAVENSNPFNQPIGEFLEEVARDNGLNPDNYESYEGIWRDLKK